MIVNEEYDSKLEVECSPRMGNAVTDRLKYFKHLVKVLLLSNQDMAMLFTVAPLQNRGLHQWSNEAIIRWR